MSTIECYSDWSDLAAAAAAAMKKKKKNEILPFAATWVDLEIIILSEISQTENNKSKNWTNETKQNSQIQRTGWWLLEKRVGGGKNSKKGQLHGDRWYL